MLIGDRWQEAEVVELQAARAAYEDFLHRRRTRRCSRRRRATLLGAGVPDPRARGQGDHRLVLGGADEQQPSRTGCTCAGCRSCRTSTSRSWCRRPAAPELTRAKQNFMPQQDLELATGRRSAEVGLRFDRLAVARIAPDVKLPQQPLTGRDAAVRHERVAGARLQGAGRAAGQAGRRSCASDGNDFPLTVACFDQTVEVVFSGKASSFSGDAQQTILARSPLGASDLTGALNFVKQHSAGHDRLLVVSDGILTAGEQERDKLRAAAGDLKHSGFRRIDAIVDGGTQDEISLKQLTVAGLERDGIVVNARMPAPLLASRVLRATRSGMKVTVPGAAWVWPETLDAVQPGDQVLVFADLPPGSDMRVELGEGDARVVALHTAERPLLERAWVKASIDRLTAMLSDGVAATTDAAKADIRRQILDLSTRYRVLSDLTALLVLETEFDYQRFGIDRKALAEILTVGPRTA
jgi:hypothetical protein